MADGPKGTGFLYISKEAVHRSSRFSARMEIRFCCRFGLDRQFAFIVGLGAAVEAMRKRGMATVEKRVIELRDRHTQFSPKSQRFR
jgi:selenocysteine lyase/cysteine desulfurase